IATERKIARHLHIPMQSGSTKILNSMNRRYTSEQYITLIDKIKKRIPECTFSTDVMVGFPGESQEDFQKTLDIMENAGFLEAFMYYWNPREGTKAVDFPNKVSQEVKLKRLEILIDKQLERTIKIKNGRLGGVQKVLVTQISRDNPGQMLGKNEHGEMVVFNSEKILEIGSMIDVKFICLKGNTFLGELFNE
ncbi:MAG: radical SAM protein, partial [Sphaerochaetaceae bacterium]|nr:radical SAM protein [Sphaerochaetaceae bacterium]